MQVLEAAGGRDEHVRLLHGARWRSMLDPAVHGGDGEGAGVAHAVELVDDLAGELAGRGQDQRLRARAVGLEPVDHRDAEGERLARSGRGLDQHVVAGEHVADDQALDGEGIADAARFERVDDRS